MLTQAFSQEEDSLVTDDVNSLFKDSKPGDYLLKDNSEVNHRSFNKEAIDSYKNDKQFRYDRKPPSASLGELIMFWVKEFLRQLFGQVDPGEQRFDIFGRLLKILFYVLAAAAILYLIWYFVKVPIRSVLGKGTSKVGYHITDENIHEINFDEKIKEALAAKDYRFAVRYTYLRLLKALSDDDIIQWTNEKTNYDYVNEINERYQMSFGVITSYFEQSWYGYKEATEEDFNNINGAIDIFENER